MRTETILFPHNSDKNKIERATKFGQGCTKRFGTMSSEDDVAMSSEGRGEEEDDIFCVCTSFDDDFNHDLDDQESDSDRNDVFGICAETAWFISVLGTKLMLMGKLFNDDEQMRGELTKRVSTWNDIVAL